VKSQYRQYRAIRESAPSTAVRRRRAAAVAGGVLAALLASIIGLDSVSNGGRLIAAVAAAAKDPASLFDNRSPGARAGGLLQQTKPGHEAPVLSHREGAKPPPPPMTKDQTAITYAPEEHPEAPPTAIPTTLAVEAATPTGDFALFSSIDGQPPGSGGGGGEGGESYFASPPGGGGGGGAITIQSTTPVPEPSVWAMLIVGFFSVGALMRAQRRPSQAQADLVRATHS
jgi:hypothetical protein